MMDKGNEHGSGQGRKKNETYTRRTNAEIHRDKTRQQQQLASRRQSFFVARTIPPATPPLQEQPPIHGKKSGGQTTIKPSIKNPLPGVDMHNIPHY